MWGYYWVYQAKAEPRLDLRPVLVCEGPPGIHEGYIQLLEETFRFIQFGQEKNGWLHWSG